MKCFKCSKEKSTFRIDPFPGPLCNSCFVKLIEKRVRKDIRINKRFKPNSVIRVVDDGSENAAVSIFLTKKIAKVIRSKVIVGDKGECDIVVVPWNLDQEIQLQLERMFTSTKSEDNTKEVKLLKTVSQKEVTMFANIKDFKFKESKPYNKDITDFINQFEDNHPEIKFSLLKSFEKIGLSK